MPVGGIECYWMFDFYSYRLINKDDVFLIHSPSTAHVLIYSGYI